MGIGLWGVPAAASAHSGVGLSPAPAEQGDGMSPILMGFQGSSTRGWMSNESCGHTGQSSCSWNYPSSPPPQALDHCLRMALALPRDGKWSQSPPESQLKVTELRRIHGAVGVEIRPEPCTAPHRAAPCRAGAAGAAFSEFSEQTRRLCEVWGAGGSRTLWQGREGSCALSWVLWGHGQTENHPNHSGIL